MFIRWALIAAVVLIVIGGTRFPNPSFVPEDRQRSLSLAQNLGKVTSTFIECAHPSNFGACVL